ncbi:thebaine 6-O-demethylase-like [Tripterygium wilfordii]|uniref:thebaine 6-O-demethylase-like n=1 Tax=Tripterygium wilfordii TaxID=458696 RepID=UPI0018F84B75|nr:thebaine 6-O-demethylase-like [Tripterygium wilfordii]
MALENYIYHGNIEAEIDLLRPEILRPLKSGKALDLRDQRSKTNTKRETLDNYSLEVNNLALVILGHMEKALKVSTGIKEAFADGAQQMQFNYYPPCPQSEKVIGLSPHSDMGLTVLQTNDVVGLQIKKNGNWLTIKPIPGPFIVNLGDMIEIITNDIYPSVEHHVIVNPKKERL